jgi:hypothetical protein
MSVHELKQHIAYHIHPMKTIVKGEKRKEGAITIVIEFKDGFMEAIDPSDDYNLTRRLQEVGSKIVGRGVLIEKIWVDEWFVAWRSYSPAIETIPWED